MHGKPKQRLMKQKINQKKFALTILKFAMAVFVIALVVVACKKAATDVVVNNSQFDVAAAKEWYYGTFKKTQQFLSINQQSSFAPVVTGKIALAKYPSWNKSSSYSKGGINYVEMPLVYNTKTILLPGMEKLSKTEQQRIANASLNKVLFAQKGNNKVVVRTVTIVPTPEYAQAKGYDISSNTLNHFDADFRGYVIVKKWDETIIKAVKVTSSTTAKKINLIHKKKSLNDNSNNTAAKLVCPPDIWVPKVYRTCVHVASGDNPAGDEGECEEWETVESPTQGEWQVVDCYDEPDDEPWPATDDCSLWQTNCEDGEWDDEFPLPSGDPCADAQANVTAATSLSQNLNYVSAKNAIQGASSTNEHSITLGKDGNGNITTSPMTNGGTTGSNVNTSWPGAIADLHNHPGDFPPSPGDLYNLIGNNKNHPDHNTKFVFTANGTTYALVVTNLSMANTFKANNPSVDNGYGPDFPNAIYNDYDNVYNYSIQNGNSVLLASEKAMAYILDQKNTGVILLKQDSNGNFKRLQTNENTENGVSTYNANNCP